jgi:hypothetical protein
MKIELLTFVGLVFSIAIILAFFLEYKASQQITSIKKDTHLARKKCEVCYSIYFISPFLKYWRCPLCGSMNKDDDYRNRNSSG